VRVALVVRSKGEGKVVVKTINLLMAIIGINRSSIGGTVGGIGGGICIVVNGVIVGGVVGV